MWENFFASGNSLRVIGDSKSKFIFSLSWSITFVWLPPVSARLLRREFCSVGDCRTNRPSSSNMYDIPGTGVGHGMTGGGVAVFDRNASGALHTKKLYYSIYDDLNQCKLYYINVDWESLTRLGLCLCYLFKQLQEGIFLDLALTISCCR